ncbi:hypothetical protein M2222_007134 [Bradyrhizobium elkanii]|jgi:hypothetical protein|nr:hypothetical protein [Bradyrhizobium elkanii]MCS3564812.1 hypothetical protein [Bradyrhizobium elkanii]MCW2145358.1 hypothetical protein [Bradyrhizobium elkanii]MCW2355825.1 hypothetical protein [Bradyrhizobium elkanii]MCW2378185.1 hypothetical protein [Bradyrhizobium elkanii]
MGPGFRQDDGEDGLQFKMSNSAVSSPAHAEAASRAMTVRMPHTIVVLAKARIHSHRT